MFLSSDPFISVIIPTYGRPVALQRCVGSLLRQQCSLRGFEIVVVDDGSYPPLLSSLPAEFIHDSRIVFLRQNHQGVSAARAIGITSARGHILAFVDDDCTVPPDYLESIDRLFRSHPETMVAQVGLENPDPNNIYGKAWKFALDRTLEINLHPDGNKRLTCGILGGVMLARREVFTVAAHDPAFVRGREDADLRYQLQRLNVAVFYEPQIKVFHHYRQTLRGYLTTFFEYGRCEFHLQQKWSGTASPFKYPRLTSWQALRSLIGTEGLVRGVEIYCLLWLKRHAGLLGVWYEKAIGKIPDNRTL